MKKLAFVIMSAFALIGLTTGCSSTHESRGGYPVELKYDLTLKPDFKAESNKVTGSSKLHNLFGVFTWGADAFAEGVNYNYSGESFSLFNLYGKAKSAAAYDACAKSDADGLIAPNYKLHEKDYIVYRTVECEVNGFPGHVNGVEVVGAKK